MLLVKGCGKSSSRHLDLGPGFGVEQGLQIHPPPTHPRKSKCDGLEDLMQKSCLFQPAISGIRVGEGDDWVGGGPTDINGSDHLMTPLW